MYKMERTYIDFDGNERTETFRFNLSKAELTKLYNSISGGLEKKLEDIIAKKDIPSIMQNFEQIMDMSYGEMSLDGRRFSKSPEILAAFKETQAYSDIFMELVTDDEASAAFIQGVMPEGLREEVEKAQNKVTVLPAPAN